MSATLERKSSKTTRRGYAQSIGTVVSTRLEHAKDKVILQLRLSKRSFFEHEFTYRMIRLRKGGSWEKMLLLQPPLVPVYVYVDGAFAGDIGAAMGQLESSVKKHEKEMMERGIRRWRAEHERKMMQRSVRRWRAGQQRGAYASAARRKTQDRP